MWSKTSVTHGGKNGARKHILAFHSLAVLGSAFKRWGTGDIRSLTNSEVTAWRSLSHLRKNSKGINNSCHKLSIPEECPSVRPRRKAFLLGHHVTSRFLFKTLKRGRGLPIYMTAEASWKPSWKAGLTSQGLSTFSLLWRLLKASLVFTLRSTV